VLLLPLILKKELKEMKAASFTLFGGVILFLILLGVQVFTKEGDDI
jgi:hypothetical protein